MMREIVKWMQSKLLGYGECPECGAWTGWSYRQHVVLFDDEPPMFAEWICKACGWTMGVEATILTERAAKTLGYENFEDYSKKNGIETPRDV